MSGVPLPGFVASFSKALEIRTSGGTRSWVTICTSWETERVANRNSWQLATCSRTMWNTPRTRAAVVRMLRMSYLRLEPRSDVHVFSARIPRCMRRSPTLFLMRDVALQRTSHQQPLAICSADTAVRKRCTRSTVRAADSDGSRLSNVLA